MPHGNVVLPDVVITVSLSDLLFQEKTPKNPKLGGVFFPHYDKQKMVWLIQHKKQTDDLKRL